MTLTHPGGESGLIRFDSLGFGWILVCVAFGFNAKTQKREGAEKN
jgi:hypothetical protein